MEGFDTEPTMPGISGAARVRGRRTGVLSRVHGRGGEKRAGVGKGGGGGGKECGARWPVHGGENRAGASKERLWLHSASRRALYGNGPGLQAAIPADACRCRAAKRAGDQCQAHAGGPLHMARVIGRGDQED
jgi:hypothetical protein